MMTERFSNELHVSLADILNERLFHFHRVVRQECGSVLLLDVYLIFLSGLLLQRRDLEAKALVRTR